MTASHLPLVSGDRLFLPNARGELQEAMYVGSDAWYTWLKSDSTRSFTLKHALGTFTARRERKRNRWYWYIYRKQHGKLHKTYLGKAEELSYERLFMVAEVLAGQHGPKRQAALSMHKSAGAVATPPADTTADEKKHVLLSQTFTLSPPDFPENGNTQQKLPILRTPLIGREREVADICALLRQPEARLVTLTGTGGIGKTRLGLQVATELAKDFADGVYFVPLASVRDSDLVLSSIAQKLGLQETGGQSRLNLLQSHLSNKYALLLLDNFEQVLAVAPKLSDLLTTCPHLKILLTSREPLHISGEHEFHVPPLAVPNLKQLPAATMLSDYPAIALFLQRARMIKPDLHLTAGNARAIAEICVRLDGLPLAIELAAARSKLLPPQALLARLERRLAVLTTGKKDAPVRHQTLRNTLDWSYDLLNKDEQWLFRHLAIFVGGCQLTTFEELCRNTGHLTTPVLDGVTSLLDKNLLQVMASDTQEPRLMMLETVHEYGLECLVANGELEPARQSHAATYCSFVEQADRALLGIDRETWPAWSDHQQEYWLDWLESEYGNLRAALDFLLERNEIEAAQRFSVGCASFWFMRGYPADGQQYMARVVEASNGIRIANKARGWVLYNAAWLTFYQSDDRRALSLLEESRQLFESLGYTRGVAACLTVLGNIEHHRGNSQVGDEMLEESLRLYRALDDCVGIGYARLTQGILAFFRGELTHAQTLFEESLNVSKQVEQRWLIASNLHYLGWILFRQGSYARARQLSEESLTLFKKIGHAGFAVEAQIVWADEAAALGDKTTAQASLEEALTRGREMESQDDIARALCGLGRFALGQGDLERARAYYEEALVTLKQEAEIPDRMQWVLTSCLEGIGEIALAQGQLARAVRLLAKAEALQPRDTNDDTTGGKRDLYERMRAEAACRLGEATFVTLWADGKNMTIEQALLTQEDDEVFPAETQQPESLPVKLTRREFEVLHLLAQGLTNAQIAEDLVISLTTVNSYLSSIYSKLGVSSRLGAMRYAIDHHLS